jgi:hypothetical protein
MRFFDKLEELTRRMHHNLRNSVMVAQVNEQNTAVIAKTIHPPGKTNRLTRVFLA